MLLEALGKHIFVFGREDREFPDLRQIPVQSILTGRRRNNGVLECNVCHGSSRNYMFGGRTLPPASLRGSCDQRPQLSRRGQALPRLNQYKITSKRFEYPNDAKPAPLVPIPVVRGR